MPSTVAGILGKKVGMTQLFDDKGDVRPVTVLKAGPCVVTQRKTAGKDGYDAAQIGLVEFVKEKKLSKAELGHLTKNNVPPVRFLREVPIQIEGSWDSDGQAKGLSTSSARARAAGLRAWWRAIILPVAPSRTVQCSRSPVRLVLRRFPREYSKACACRDTWERIA
jgi:hypothetical protein